MASLIIDDKVEDKGIKADRVAVNYAQGIAALEEQYWDVLYLDHDLGDFSGPGGRELNGYSIMCWLEQHPEHLPGRIVIVSHNPVGRVNMMAVIRKLYS